MNLNIKSSISVSAIKNQLTTIWPAILVGIVVSLGGAGVTVLVAAITHNPIWKLAKDPSQVMDYGAYIGMLSNWGVLLWISAAAICLFSTVLLIRHHAPTATRNFMGISGILSLSLGVDDLYLLHDRILPKLFDISEDVFYILYLIVLVSYLIYFSREILKYEYLLLGAAFFLFGLSRRIFIIIPFFDQFMTTGDMLKYFGIVFWLIFYYRTAFQEVSNLIRPRESSS